MLQAYERFPQTVAKQSQKHSKAMRVQGARINPEDSITDHAALPSRFHLFTRLTIEATQLHIPKIREMARKWGAPCLVGAPHESPKRQFRSCCWLWKNIKNRNKNCHRKQWELFL